MDEEMMEMLAMEEMMGGGGGAPPMEPMMGEGDGSGVTEIPVPDFAVPAVLELIAMLEEEMMASEGPAL